MSNNVPMSINNDGFSATISKLIDSSIKIEDDDGKKDFLRVLTTLNDIPLSNLNKKDMVYFESTVRYIMSLYNSSNEVTDEEYVRNEALELGIIARMKRAENGFERKSLNKQIQERRNVTDSNQSSSILSKLFGSHKSKKGDEF